MGMRKHADNAANVGRVSTRQATSAHGDVGLCEEAALVPGRGNPTYGANLINGDIPEHWEFTTLGEVCRRGGGNIQTGPFGSQLHASDYVPVGVPSIMPTNIGENRIIEDGIVRITEADANRLCQHRLRAGDIVYSRRGDVEKRALIRGREEGWFCGTGCLKVRLGSGVVDPLFASLYLGHPSVREWIVRHAVGATMPNLNTSIMSAVPFALPPLPEQKAIAHILGTLDDKIELNRRMNATLEAMARTLFQSWFVDFDPVRAKLDGRKPAGLDAATAALFPAHFQDSHLGHIPQGWEVLPLYETAKFINGAAFKSEDFCATGEGLPVVKIAELKDGISAQTKWSQRQAGSDQLIDTDDLLYSWSGSPDTSLDAFLWTKGPGLLNQHIFKVVAPTTAQKRFVYYLLKYLRPILVETARNKQTTGLGHVTVADMKRLLVCWPTKEILAAFDQKIAPIFDRALANTIEGQTLATLRDALLPKLLSGELSVAAAQEAEASA
jgi:type I restriction enzyme S subunit